MGTRPAVRKAFALQLGNGLPVQAMTVVGRASGISGYEPGSVTRVTSTRSRFSQTISGQAWVLDNARGMFVNVIESVSEYAYGVSWHPTQRKMAYFTINGHLNGVPVPVYTRVRMIDCDPNSDTFQYVLWQTDVRDNDPGGLIGTFPLYANAVLVTAVFTYVCAGHWVFVLRTSDGTYLKRYNMNDWSEEVMHVALRTDGRLAVAFRGVQTVRGPVTTQYADTGNANGEGSHFRAGIMLFDVDTTKTAVNDSMLTPVQYGAKRTATSVNITGVQWTQATKRLFKTGAFASYTHASGRLIRISGGTGITTGSYLVNSKISNDEIELVSSIGPNASDVAIDQFQPPWYEDHVYFRISEHVAMSPRGRYPNSICATPDGGLAVATCNRGWGPNATFLPDNTVPPRSVLKISAGTSGAALAWETDVGSRLDQRTTVINGVPTTHHNDIPHPSDAVNNPGDPHPTCDAICADADGNLYVGGRTNASGYSVRKLRGTDGALLWEQDCGGDGDWVPQHGVAFNTQQNMLVVCGKRNNAWDGSGGAQAILWFIDPVSGLIVDSYDLSESVNAWGVACNSFGDTAFVTDFVPL